MTRITREEAIKILKSKMDGSVDTSYEWCEAIRMAIEALQNLSKPNNTCEVDLISRANAIRWVKTECNPYGKPTLDFESGKKVIKHLKQMPSAEPKTEWIPFTKRPLTDEEKEEYPDWIYIFDCPLPADEEEILLSNGKHVWTDTFINDGECYLDGGDDIDEGMAWMPLPEPYKGGEDE